MLFDHGLGVVEAETVTLDIVDVSGRDPVEFLEYVLLLVGSYPYAVVFDAYFNAAGHSLRLDYDMDGRTGIFYGVVDEVADDVPEMEAVCVNDKSVF